MKRPAPRSNTGQYTSPAIAAAAGGDARAAPLPATSYATPVAAQASLATSGAAVHAAPAPPSAAAAPASRAAPVGVTHPAAFCAATLPESFSADRRLTAAVASGAAYAPAARAAAACAGGVAAACAAALAAGVAAAPAAGDAAVPAAPVSSFKPRLVFLTVGTTQFDTLTRAAAEESFLQLLACLGCRHLRMQIGAGVLPPLPPGFTVVQSSSRAELANVAAAPAEAAASLGTSAGTAVAAAAAARGAAAAAAVTGAAAASPAALLLSRGPRETVAAAAVPAAHGSESTTLDEDNGELYFSVSVKHLLSCCLPDASSAATCADASPSLLTHAHRSSRRNSNSSSSPRDAEEQLFVSFFRYKESLAEEVAAADLVLSHCGAGSVLQSLRRQKRLVAVVNSLLQHNHQQQLARALQQLRCCSIVERLEGPLRCKQQQQERPEQEQQQQEQQQEEPQRREDHHEQLRGCCQVKQRHPEQKLLRHQDRQVKQQQEEDERQQQQTERQQQQGGEEHVLQRERFLKGLSACSELHLRVVEICDAAWEEEEEAEGNSLALDQASLGPDKKLMPPAGGRTSTTAAASLAASTTPAAPAPAAAAAAADARAAAAGTVPEAAAQPAAVRRLRRLPPASLAEFYSSIATAVGVHPSADSSSSAARAGTTGPAAPASHDGWCKEERERGQRRNAEEKGNVAPSGVARLLAAACSVLERVAVADLLLLLFALLLLQLLLSLPI